MSSIKTLEKCRKIMSLFDQVKPHNKENVPVNRKSSFNPKSKPNPKISLCNSRSKSKQFKPIKKVSKDTSQKNSLSKYSLNSSVSQSKNKSNNLKSCEKFQNPYNKVSRFDKIMKLKVQKPQPNREKSRRNSYMQSSLNSSLNSSLDGSFADFSTKTPLKQSEKKLTRYEKIMKLKVHKPQVQSTLKNYKPQKSSKKLLHSRDSSQNSVILLKECKEKLKKERKQVQKEDRLWKLFERERDLRVQQKKKNQEKQYEREMSLEKRFDYLVRKQLKRIEENRERNEYSDSLLF